MTPEKLFHQMLELADQWEVIQCEFEQDEGLVRLHVRETKAFWSAYRCPEDQGKVTCYDHTEELVWRHLNVFEHRDKELKALTSVVTKAAPAQRPRGMGALTLEQIDREVVDWNRFTNRKSAGAYAVMGRSHL
jgi:hypothetical protein